MFDVTRQHLRAGTVAQITAGLPDGNRVILWESAPGDYADVDEEANYRIEQVLTALFAPPAPASAPAAAPALVRDVPQA